MIYDGDVRKGVKDAMEPPLSQSPEPDRARRLLWQVVPWGLLVFCALMPLATLGMYSYKKATNLVRSVAVAHSSAEEIDGRVHQFRVQIVVATIVLALGALAVIGGLGLAGDRVRQMNEQLRERA